MGVDLRRGGASGLATLTLALATAVGACGGDPASPNTAGDEPKPAEQAERESRPDEPRERGPAVAVPDPPVCVDDGVACVRAGGRILYVERVDPDGDGDAHFVTSSPDSVTAPGITIFDVRTDLRPDPLPGPGDAISASGPVFGGSYGQRQIEADAVAVAYAP